MTAENNRHIYYGIAIEYDYPMETNYYLKEKTYDDIEEALAECESICDIEYESFCDICGNALKPTKCKDKNNETIGIIITCKNKTDRWWFLAKIIKIPLGIQITKKGNKE